VRTPTRLPDSTRLAIVAEYERIMGAVRPWVGMARPPRKDRHGRAWRPIDGAPKGYRRLPPGGGKPRDAVDWTAVDLLAMLYQEHTGRAPGSGESGPFIDLVAEALGRQDVRKLIRGVLAARRKAIAAKSHSSGL
jgi:hypothetical protein